MESAVLSNKVFAFSITYHQSIAQVSQNRIEDALTAVDEMYAALYRQHPFKHYAKAEQLLSTIVTHPTLNELFRLQPS